MENKIKIYLPAIVILTLMLIGILFTDIFTGKVVEEDTIKIGFIGPLTGPVSNPGVYIKNSFNLANSQNPSINGKNIQVIYEDGKCTPSEAVSAAKKLIEIDDVDIVVSAMCGGSTLAIAPITESKGMILFSPVSGTPKVTDAGDFVFRSSSSVINMATRASEMIGESDYESIAIIYENTDFGNGWKDSFVSKYEGKIVEIETFSFGSQNVRTELLKINNKKPDAIVMIAQSPASAIILIKQAEELGIEAELIGNEAFFSNAVITSTGDKAEGIKLVYYKYNTGSKMDEFLIDYKNKYGEEIPDEIFGALGYDGYNLLYDAIKSCDGANSVCLRDYLYDVENKQGISGTFSIDENGDAIRDFVWWEIRDGKFVRVTS